ncbi:MAG: nucleoside deaminase [Pseudomonadota bacterium]
MDNNSSARDRELLQQCIDHAVASVAGGGGPFAAMIVREGQVLAMASNCVTLHSDPTAHAEVGAIRKAAALLGDPHLQDCVLYSSCEPCPMCLAASLWAHVTRIVYAAPHAEAVRAGFDDTAFALQLFGQTTPVALPAGRLQQLQLPDAGAPFDAWLAKPNRQPY